MSYTAATLITKAWYLSGIVSRGFETVEKDQLADGLDLLNALLATMTIDNRLIPYYKEYSVTSVIGQESYFIPNLINAETLTFGLGNVRIPSRSVKRDAFFGGARVDGINSLPSSWHTEPVLGGATLYLYPLPNVAYPLKLWGKFALGSVTADQDLSLTLADFLIQYLRYALADYMCSEDGVSFAPKSAQHLERLEQKLMYFSPPDLTMTKISSLGQSPSINYATVNLSGGWTP